MVGAEGGARVSDMVLNFDLDEYFDIRQGEVPKCSRSGCI